MRRILVCHDVFQAQAHLARHDLEFSRLHGMHHCKTAEETPCFKPGKWTINAQRRIALYGHDAKNTKNFTLHFEKEDQCESLDRLWFGEVWIPVEKYACEAQSAQAQDRVLDPAELDLEPRQDEPELCFSQSQARDPAYALLDSGATHVLLPGHMLPRGARSLEFTVNLAVGNKKHDVGEMKYTQKTELIHFFHLGDLPTYSTQNSFGRTVRHSRGVNDRGQQFEALRCALWSQQAQPQTMRLIGRRPEKMSTYLNQGVKATMCETTPFVNTVGT